MCSSKQYSIKDFITTFTKKSEINEFNENKKMIKYYNKVYEKMIDKQRNLFNVIIKIIDFSLKNNKSKEEVDQYIEFIFEGIFYINYVY